MVYLFDKRQKNNFRLSSKAAKHLNLLCWVGLLLLGKLDVTLAQDEPLVQARVTKPEPPRTVARTYNGQVPNNEIKQGVDIFFSSLIKGDIAKAFTTYLTGTRLAAREDSVRNLVENTEHAVTLYGKMNSFEPIDTYQIGSHLVITTYLTALQVTPLRWRFVYYKADTTWQLLDLRVDDQISDIVEQ